MPVFQDEVVTNDRWGKGCYCKHGGYFNCDDRYTPGKLPEHKWEKCQTIDTHSWGYRRDMKLNELMDLPSIIKVRERSSHLLQLMYVQSFSDELFGDLALM